MSDNIGKEHAIVDRIMFVNFSIMTMAVAFVLISTHNVSTEKAYELMIYGIFELLLHLGILIILSVIAFVNNDTVKGWAYLGATIITVATYTGLHMLFAIIRME